MKQIRTELYGVALSVTVLTLLLAVQPGFADITYNNGGTYNIDTSMPVGTINTSGGTILNVLSGGSITGGNENINYGINSSGSSPVKVYGGNITGTITGVNGNFGYGIFADAASPVTVYNGNISGVITMGNGNTGYGIWADHSSPVNVYGGTISGAVNGGTGNFGYGIYADDSSLVNIHGGTITGGNVGSSYGIASSYNSVVNVYGGNIRNEIFAELGGTVHIFGSGFNYNYGLVNAASGDLIGTLADGTHIDVSFQNFEGNIILSQENPRTPIPAGAWLLGSGFIGLAGLRRREKNNG